LDKKGGNFLNKKNNDDEHEDDFDKNDEWGDLWGNFKFLGDSNFFKNIINRIMKDFLKQTKDFPNFGKFTPEELMKSFGKHHDKFNLQGPFLYGINLSVGPDGKPKISKFGNIQPKMGKREIVNNFREPLTEVMEEEDYIIIVAEMPGIKKTDIELKATEYSLTISAESDINKRKYKKNVNLLNAIDPDHAKARYQNGILEIKLNKIAGKAKNISID